MPSPLSYVRRFRYDRVARIALVETGPSHLIAGVARELREIFPVAHLEVLLREEDAVLGNEIEATVVRVVRFEERAELIERLRAEPFDLIVFQLSRDGSLGLRSLPFVLRGNALMAFNDSLDHFPVNVFRLRDLANHFGLGETGLGLVLSPVLTALVIVSAGWIYVRGAARRLLRPLRRGAPVRSRAHVPASHRSAAPRSEEAPWPG